MTDAMFVYDQPPSSRSLPAAAVSAARCEVGSHTEINTSARPLKAAVVASLVNGWEAMVAALAGAVAAVLTHEQVVTIFCLCVVGGGVFGFAGSIIGHMLPGPDSSQLSDRKRWLANWAGALAIGPTLTWYAHANWFPEAPVEFIAFAASGFIGFFFVTAIFLLPAYLKYRANEARSRMQFPPKRDDPPTRLVK
jgi:hypothetical protein